MYLEGFINTETCSELCYDCFIEEHPEVETPLRNPHHDYKIINELGYTVIYDSDSNIYGGDSCDRCMFRIFPDTATMYWDYEQEKWVEG